MSKALFYSTYSCNPYFNMAMDEWMFARVSESRNSVLLRLYSWDKGAITFGHNQNEKSAVNFDLLERTPLIRRITGGRALYHEQSELTYSIAAKFENSDSAKLAGSVQNSSLNIAKALIVFLSNIGISAQYMRQSSADFNSSESLHTRHCFQSKARNEIISGQRKIIASAQRRIGSAFLQHGSIKIKETETHPALSNGSSKLIEDSAIVGLEASTFADYSAIFQGTFSNELQLVCDARELSSEERSELDSRSEFLRNSPLLKRNLIKQIPKPVSL